MLSLTCLSFHYIKSKWTSEANRILSDAGDDVAGAWKARNHGEYKKLTEEVDQKIEAHDQESQNDSNTEEAYGDLDATQSERDEDDDEKESHSIENGGSTVRTQVLTQIFQANLTCNLDWAVSWR